MGKNVGSVVEVQISNIGVRCSARSVNRPQGHIPTEPDIQREAIAYSPLILNIRAVHPPPMGCHKHVAPQCVVGDSQEKRRQRVPRSSRAFNVGSLIAGKVDNRVIKWGARIVRCELRSHSDAVATDDFREVAPEFPSIRQKGVLNVLSRTRIATDTHSRNVWSRPTPIVRNETGSETGSNQVAGEVGGSVENVLVIRVIAP